MPSSVEYLTESDVLACLSWDTLVPEMEAALSRVSAKSVLQPTRLLMPLPEKEGVFLAMPCFSKEDNSLGCKLVTTFLGNKQIGLPSVYARLVLFEGDTGRPKVIMEGNQITGWRTAATSVSATKHLHKGKKEVLAILGAGTQARTHALAMKHYFKFPQVRIWSRNYENAVRLCKELGPGFEPCESGEKCTMGADVVCTATFATQPILKRSWIKNGAHINALGAGINHHSEVDMETYREASIFTDHMATAEKELKGLLNDGIKILGEVGEVINGKKKVPETATVTIFHSLGMAVEDILTGNLVYEKYKKNNILN